MSFGFWICGGEEEDDVDEDEEVDMSNAFETGFVSEADGNELGFIVSNRLGEILKSGSII